MSGAILARVSSELMVAEPEPAVAAAPRGEWWLLDRLAAVAAVLSGLLLYALIGRGGWYVDDFVNFGLTQQMSFGKHYLLLPIFGHPQPAVRLVNGLLYRIAPMNYHLAIALVCLAVAVTAWMVYRVLRLAFRPSPWHLILTAVAGISGLWVPVAAWWAGGSEVIFGLVAYVLIVHAVLHCYLSPRRWLWALLAAFWLWCGVAFYERTLFGGVFAAWFVLAVACRSARPRELLRVLRRIWPAYLTMLVASLLYLGFYFLRNGVRKQPGYTHTELLHFLWVCWSHTLIPALFGGTLRTHQNGALSYAYPPLWWLIACQLGWLALVAWGIRRTGLRAVASWLVFIVLFLPAQYAIATARLTTHGPGVGDEFRYLADLFPLLVLIVGLSLLRPGVRFMLPAAGTVPAAGSAARRFAEATADPAEPSGDPGPAGEDDSVPATDRPAKAGWRAGLPPVRRPHLVATVAALAVLGTVFGISALPVSHRWLHNRGIRYVDNLRAEVAVRDRAGPWSMYTTFAPQSICPNAFGRYCEAPAIAQLVTGHRVSTDNLGRPIYLVDADGHLRPARFRTLATVPAVCSTGRGKIMQQLNHPVPKGLWNVQLAYRVSQPTTLRFALDPGTGVAVEATGSFQGFSVKGSGRLTFLLRQTAVTAFRLDAAVAGACISDVRIGQPVPAG